jgi:hypothetical protein
MYSMEELNSNMPVLVVGAVMENGDMATFRFENLEEAAKALPNLSNEREYTHPMKDRDSGSNTVYIRFESWSANDLLSR